MTRYKGDCFVLEPVLSHVLPVPSMPRGACRRVVEGGLAMTGKKMLQAQHYPAWLPLFETAPTFL
jgi:hypothetical protein